YVHPTSDERSRCWSSAGSGDPRALHAFPTRRSSDLGAPGEVIAVEDDAIIVACGQGAVAVTEVQPEGKTPMSGADFVRGYRVRADRKSTRLNSSHVKISYAVFCLKKKTKLHERRCNK